MIGRHIRNYQITAHLGEGGMGSVYSATDDVLGRNVALKMLHSTLTNQPQFLDRFRKEARVLAQLLHPNIAVIYNFIEQDDNHYMVMEFVEGRNLEWIQKNYPRLPVKIVVAIFLQALEGLRHAHKKGILHRDIKPANLNLTPDGTVKLMDFGIALMAGEQRLTQVNRIVGTIEFLAPELIQGKPPSPASDIYAVGATMYELLTGRLPFESNSDFNLMQDILKKKPLAADRLAPSIGKSLSNIIMKSLEKNPEDRFADARVFQQALLTACPEAKDVDLSIVYTLPVAVATQVVQVSSANMPAANRLSTIAAGIRSLATFINTQFASMQLKHLALIVAAIVITGSVFLLASGGKSSDQGTTTKVGAIIKDSTIEPLSESGEQILTLPVQQAQVVIPEPNPEEKTGVEKTDEPRKEEDKSTQKKKGKTVPPAEKEARDEEIKDVAKKEPDPVPEPIKEEPPPKPKPAARSVQLDARLEVSLYLLNPLDAATAQSGQQLQFSVTSPVSYNGEIIIENGALATGQIKSVSNKKISIVFVNVTSRSGQKLPFISTEFSGRIAHMLSSRSYSASLRKGIVINL